MNDMPKHIAIIMDGNRRWAKQNSLNYKIGHKKGAETLEKIAKYANKIGLKALTVYAFSTENWKRSEEEVGALMLLLRNYLDRFSKDCDVENIRINIIGHINALEEGLKNSIINAMEKTKNNTGVVLNIAINYGGRDEITRAVKKIAEEITENRIKPEDINEQLIYNYLDTKNQPEPDLIIRTGGEIRLSNFLTWESVYSEFLFMEKYWPDFTEEDLDNAINVFQNRKRNFGGK